MPDETGSVCINARGVDEFAGARLRAQESQGYDRLSVTAADNPPICSLGRKTQSFTPRKRTERLDVSREALFPQSTLICSGCPEQRP